ncbi:MAG: hypothetical protein QOI02_1458 [Actinomycetota bacterium]|nr:hypothetical protein [Actinomycetota bacterium]
MTAATIGSYAPRAALRVRTAPVRTASAPAAPAAPQLRITARGRAVLLALVATPLVLVAIALGMNAGGATATSQAPVHPLQTVIVLPGQSLWQVAEQVAPTSDPREFIQDVVDLNGLGSAVVQPGQQLDIPAEYSVAASE